MYVNRILRFVGYMVISSLLATVIGCSKDDEETGTILTDTCTITSTNQTGTPEGDTDNTAADDDDIVGNFTFDNVVQIVFSENSATITNPVSGSGVDITQSDGDVTIESTIAGVEYEISGTVSDGSLKIYSDSKFKLTLNDASITNSDGPAINIQSGKTAFVVLEGENTLSDASSYQNIPDDEDAKGAFFSEGQLVFSGTGSVSIAGKYKHGIVSDDYVRIIEGTVEVTEVVKDAIHTNDYVVVDGGNIYLQANSDGIDCEEGYIVINDGNFVLDVADDGIVASYDIEDETNPDPTITPYVTINGGEFEINTSEGEGIESKSILTINGGTFEINAYDDGLNAIEDLYINDGDLYVYSSTNDAIDSNGDITITGGIIIAIGAGQPEGGIDADNNPIMITGGTVLGLGGTTTSPNSSSTQNSVIMDGISANKILHIQSTDGTEALTYQIPKSVSTILYSSAKLVSNETYYIYTGGEVSDGEDFNGLYTSGTYSNGISANSSFYTSSAVTSIGGSTGPGGH